MQHQQDDSPTDPAPTHDPAKREQAKQLAAAAAWDERKECSHCDGTGTMPGGRRIVHSVSPSGLGADWDLDDLLAAIDTAPSVAWSASLLGDHQLLVDIDGKPYRFQVQRPVVVAGRAGGEA